MGGKQKEKRVASTSWMSSTPLSPLLGVKLGTLVLLQLFVAYCLC